MRLDMHAHYVWPKYLTLLKSEGAAANLVEPGARLTHPTPEADFAERFDAMDRAHVDKQIISGAAVAPYLTDANGAARCARFANDHYASMVRDRPNRFAAFATLPLPHVDVSLAELVRALDELGMWGVTITTSIQGLSLADPSLDELYAELDRRGAVLFLHPAGLACGSQSLVETGLTWPLGSPFEDTMAVLELLQTGFVARYPRIKLMVPHLGGTLPFLMQRLDQMAQRFMPDRGVPSELVRHFWYDSVNASPGALRLAIEAFGIERIVFGTDWPFWKGDAHQLAADYLGSSGLTGEEIDAIDSGNARSLFARVI